jgi:hypothetical protein
MKATERYRYALLPKIKLRLKKKPIGKMAFMYTSLFIFSLWRESSMFVVRARTCVMIVAKSMCHVVRTMAFVACQ